MIISRFTIILVSFLWCSNMQGQSVINVMTDTRSSSNYQNSISSLTIRRNDINPFVNLENVVFDACMNNRFEMHDHENNVISSELMLDILSLNDTITIYDYDTKEKTIKYNKRRPSSWDIIGYEVNLKLEIEEGRLSSKMKTISPIFLFPSRVPKPYFKISPNSVCADPDFGYLVRSLIDKGDHNSIRDYLYEVLDGKQRPTFYNSNLHELGDFEIEQILYHTDTIHIVSYDSYFEEVKIVRTELLKEDLDIELLGEFIYCSDISSFAYIPKAVGLSATIYDEETRLKKSREILFYVKLD